MATSGVGLVVAVVVPVAGVILPFTFAPAPAPAEEIEIDAADGVDVCFGLILPLNGGIDWINMGIFFTAVSDFEAVGPSFWPAFVAEVWTIEEEGC